MSKQHTSKQFIPLMILLACLTLLPTFTMAQAPLNTIGSLPGIISYLLSGSSENPPIPPIPTLGILNDTGLRPALMHQATVSLAL